MLTNVSRDCVLPSSGVSTCLVLTPVCITLLLDQYISFSQI